MKLQMALLPLVAAMALAGCGRGDAQVMVGQADGIVSKVREEAAVTAPEELKKTEAMLADLHRKFDDRDYEAVKAEVPEFNEQLAILHTVMKTKADANAAATVEWGTLSAAVPKSVEAIQAKVDSLKPESLPKDVTKEELATANTELEAIKATWTEATNAAGDGKTIEAVEKGRIVQTKTEELKNSLGLNPQLASN
jgi:hypothetical protein